MSDDPKGSTQGLPNPRENTAPQGKKEIDLDFSSLPTENLESPNSLEGSLGFHKIRNAKMAEKNCDSAQITAITATKTSTSENLDIPQRYNSNTSDFTTNEDSESEKSEIGKLSLIDLLAASAAAATATVIGGKLGVAGTVIGAALASAICTIAAASYKTLGYKAKDVAKTALPGNDLIGSRQEFNDEKLAQQNISEPEISVPNHPGSKAESTPKDNQNNPPNPEPVDSAESNIIVTPTAEYVFTYTVSMRGSRAPLKLKISEPANPAITPAKVIPHKGSTSRANRLWQSLARNWERIVLLILSATIIGISAILIPERISGQAWTPGTSDLQSRVGPSFPAYREVVVSKPTVTVVTKVPAENPQTPAPTVTVTLAPKPNPTTAPSQSTTDEQPKENSGTSNDEHNDEDSNPKPR